jgi:hypothetical protein
MRPYREGVKLGEVIAMIGGTIGGILNMLFEIVSYFQWYKTNIRCLSWHHFRPMPVFVLETIPAESMLMVKCLVVGPDDWIIRDETIAILPRARMSASSLLASG